MRVDGGGELGLSGTGRDDGGGEIGPTPGRTEDGAGRDALGARPFGVFAFDLEVVDLPVRPAPGI